MANDEQQQQQGHECVGECTHEVPPTERVFCEMLLFLDTDNRPTGHLTYHGNRLKELKVDTLTATECRMICEAVQELAQKAIYQIGSAVELMSALSPAAKESNGNS